MVTPLLLVVAAAIACEGKGPVLFRQSRTGLHGSKFFIYKFRTMTVLEDGEFAVQCRINDHRVTYLGHFLRKFGIDELPQLANVVLGDMSLVGPRPHAPAQDQEFISTVPDYLNRYQVKPGITGLAQILGYRGPAIVLASMAVRVEADNTYVRNQSILLDLMIILLTIPAIIFTSNTVK
jgi:putative colanic acid biosysnthesis UDP-glucose lipid carrier transferase